MSKSGEIMRAIMVHQIQKPGKAFYEALELEMAKATDPRDLEFRVYTTTNELIFRSGQHYGKRVRHPEGEMLGFNFHAEHLKECAAMVMGDTPMENPLFDELLVNFSMFNPHIPRSVLIVSDSQASFMHVVKGGDDIPVGGGKYQDMINVLESGRFELSEYKWIVVYCSINCSVRPGYEFQQRDR